MKKILCLFIVIFISPAIAMLKTSQQEFFEAVQAGDLDNIKSLIGKVGVNIQDAKGNTALMVAVAANKPQVVDFLIAQGANVNQSNAKPDNLFKDTALNIAIYNKNLEMVKLLIQKGANVNQESNFEGVPLRSPYFKNTPLLNAIENSTSAIVEYLLQKGANPNMSDEADLTPLYYATAMSDLEKIRLLAKYGANVNYQMHQIPKPASGNEKTVLMWAAKDGEADIVQELIKLGADPLLEDSGGRNAYALASDAGYYALIANNEKLSKKLSKIMNTLRPAELSKAIRMGKVERVRGLLVEIDDVNQLTTSDGKTAYDLARDKFEKTTGDEKELYKEIMNLLERREKEIKQISSSIEQSLIQAIRKFTQTLQALQIAINKE